MTGEEASRKEEKMTLQLRSTASQSRNQKENELAGRCVLVEKLGKIEWGSAIDIFVNHSCEFVSYVLLFWFEANVGTTEGSESWLNGRL